VTRFANLADKPKPSGVAIARVEKTTAIGDDADSSGVTGPLQPTAKSRVGRKAIAAYFSPEMSLAMHVCARKYGLSLQDLMAEAFNDVLRKYGQSPVGE
jgi:hypothetical protein